MNYKKVFAVVLGSLSLLYAHTVVFAESYIYEPIVGIPGVEGAENFDSYIDALYALSISIAALIAVIKIVIAGAKYMLSDLISTKSDAKNDIKNSLIGLLIIIAAVVILNTINSDLTNLSLFDIEDQIYVNSERPTQQQQTMQEWCDNLAAEGKPCEPIGCESSTFKQAEPFLNPSGSCDPNLDCRARCTALGGTYQDEWFYNDFNDQGCYQLDINSVQGSLVASAEARAQAVTTSNRNGVIGINCRNDDSLALNQCVDPNDDSQFSATSKCENECLNELQDESGVPNDFDEAYRVCIISIENNPVGLTETECNYYSRLGWSWDGNQCVDSDSFISGNDDIVFSESAKSEIDTVRQSGLANQGVSLDEVESAVFVSLEKMEEDGQNQEQVKDSLEDSCAGEIYYDSVQTVNSSSNSDYVGFYCVL